MKADKIGVRVDTETKKKAMLMLKCKGKTLSQAVREMITNLAKEYDKKNSK